MSHYLLSTFSVEDAEPGAPPTPEMMQEFMRRIITLEDELEDAGAFVFGGALHSHDASTVARNTGGDVVLTDGPFAEAKEHIAGFYIIEAADLDEATTWAGKVSGATGRPIEVRPFHATGKAKDHLPEIPSA